MARIAVVEDDVDTSRFIGDALRDSGYETISYFRPSEDTLEHLRTYQPDLIVLDARLNSTVTGWDIIEALKADPDTDRIPVIVCSGAADEIATHQDLLQRFDVPVLAKPFDLSDLDTLVDRLLVG